MEAINLLLVIIRAVKMLFGSAIGSGITIKVLVLVIISSFFAYTIYTLYDHYIAGESFPIQEIITGILLILFILALAIYWHESTVLFRFEFK